VSVNNPEMEPKGSEGEGYALATDDYVQDLLQEIDIEPELADPRLVGRPTAMARLDDAELVQQVLFELNVGGPAQRQAYRQLFDDLWLYAWPVLKGLLRTNRMNQVVRRYLGVGASIKPEDMVTLAHSEAERDDLAIDVILRSVKSFEKNAIRLGKWSPTGGACLRTWFIGTCAMNFPRSYYRWASQRTDRLIQMSQRHRISNAPEDLDDLVAGLPDPTQAVLDRIALRSLLSRIQPDTQYILGRIMQGATYPEIADELRWSVGAVTQRVYRLRKRVLLSQKQETFIWDDAA
jgi:DNA-directed RNA polymerase specialized sigma24 family protein